MGELERFQATMLVILSEETDGERIRERLLAHPDSEPFREWVQACEPRMLAVGGSLVKKWNRAG